MRKLILFMMLLLLCLPHAAAEESLIYANEGYGISFTLPEGWQDVSDENMTVFANSGDMLLLIGPTGHTVDARLASSLNATVAEEWVRNDRVFEDIVFTKFVPIMFSSAVDENGKLFAFHSCGFAGEGFPEDFLFLYMQYLFTDSTGELCGVSLLTPNNDASYEIFDWFDAMVMENIPENVLMALYEQIDE